jgi:hypothetical protein
MCCVLARAQAWSKSIPTPSGRTRERSLLPRVASSKGNEECPPMEEGMAQAATAGTMTGKPLIESDRVEGTTVYDPSGNKIGSIERPDDREDQWSSCVCGNVFRRVPRIWRRGAHNRGTSSSASCTITGERLTTGAASDATYRVLGRLVRALGSGTASAIAVFL